MDEPKPVQIDADGTRWWRFLFEYDWDGKTYHFAIVAPSRDDAEARLRRLPLARYVGQASGAPIPATSPRAWLVPGHVVWLNLRRWLAR